MVSNNKIFYDFLLRKDYDQILEFWGAKLPKDAVIIDIGANMGQCMMRYSKIAPKGLIISIEPIKSTFYFLQKAVNILKRKNVILLNLAVGDSFSSQNIYIPISTSGIVIDTQASLDASQLSQRGLKYLTEIIVEDTLSNIVENNKLEKINLIKIDAEGYEEQILKSSMNIIVKYKPIISLESIHTDEFLTELYNYGYSAYYIIDNDLISSFSVKPQGNLILIYKSKS